MRKAMVLGIMSGTSLDGVDYALCEAGPSYFRLVESWHLSFPRELHAVLRGAVAGTLSSHETAQLHHDLGRLYARGAAFGRMRIKPELAGLHGQTIFHHPHPLRPATLQLGEPAYLVEALGVPVVSNYRSADLAAGGQGAPLATFFHQAVFAEKGCHVCVNNLGGISNVTSLDWREGRRPALLSFDTGPGNVLLDLAAQTLSNGRRACDLNGAWAGRGSVHEARVRSWLRHSYFRKAPPKSTGRELFGESFWKRLAPSLRKACRSREDILATLTAFTAESLALNYQRHLPCPPDRVVLCGGGSKNPVLRKQIAGALASRLGAMEVVTSDALGWPASAVEPAAFAWLAWQRHRRNRVHDPKTTGARRNVWLGQITEP